MRPAVKILAFLLALLAAFGSAGLAEGDPPGENVRFSQDPASIEAAAASVVRLEVFDDRDVRIATGSGFVAFEPAVLVTAAHVVVNMDYMIATKDDGATFRVGHVIAADTDMDIAFCELPEDASIPPLRWAEGETARGEATVAISSQFGLINLVTLGNICGRWNAGGIRWILFTAQVSGGSSGGPLLNSDGLVIGVIMGTYDKGQNLNLAVPYESVTTLFRSNENGGGTSK